MYPAFELQIQTAGIFVVIFGRFANEPQWDLDGKTGPVCRVTRSRLCE